MALSWNEIKKNAIEFSKSWEDVEREKAEAQTFWNEFFAVFGQNRRRVAVLEQQVKKLNESKGYIDLFWPKTLIAEAKSRGKDLVKAREQAIEYLNGIPNEDLPQYILTTDFESMALYELETEKSYSFKVSKLHENIKLFSFIAGYSKTDFKAEDPVNIKAAELMGKLHDSLYDEGYQGHQLEIFLVRILFCLFADDTGIFEKGIFADLIHNKTREDGSDLGPQLAYLFQVLNTPEDKRPKNIDEDFAKFPYVNGKLFEEHIDMASFDSKMRFALQQCCLFNWSGISPAVFGSLFQSVMDQEKRRNLGAHYTSEENILKLIRPLFLDELKEEFEKIKTNKNKLKVFHEKLSTLKFLDPACGCGNFLVITYRELRLLELEILKIIHKEQIKSGALALDLGEYLKLNVDQMYGIEIEEFPAKIAEVAMWLVDHQMNMKVSEELGRYYVRLPLRKSANIVNIDALEIDWDKIVTKDQLDYILGNPPFIGHHLQNERQKNQQKNILIEIPQAGIMDYVSCWYVKAAKFIQNSNIKVAFVSTNSITQGEQAGFLWNLLFNKYNISINFAHRTFQWNSEARGKAAVHVVIIGFSIYNSNIKYLFEYENIRSEPHQATVSRINQYLVEAESVILTNRSTPIHSVPNMRYGNKPTDGGYYLLNEEEKDTIIQSHPLAHKFIKPFIGAKEFISGQKKWCIWLVDADPLEIAQIPLIVERIKLVENFRQKSKALSTRKYPYKTLFRQITQPQSDFLLVPRTTSENRKYIPISFFNKNYVVGDTCQSIASADDFIFGILTSEMHMTWVKYTAGRLKSDYRYSKDIVYNNFPWPENPSKFQMQLVREKAKDVLNTRKEFPNSTLGDLYNSLTMPPKLLKAHKELDLAVERCYRKKSFKDERERIEFLFERYKELTSGGQNNITL